MNGLDSWLVWLLERLERFATDVNRGPTLALTLLVLLFTLALERRSTARRGLGLRNVATDAIYMAVYFGGVFAVLVSTPTLRLLDGTVDSVAPWLRQDLSPVLPWVFHMLVFFLVSDLVGYFVHRLQHASPLLWAFHSIHHSQERMNALTNFRFHFVDTLVMLLARYVPALLVTPQRIWLPASLTVLVLHLLAHTGREWRFGPLEGILVSPGFHSVHHSLHADHADRNFGMLFSFWDRLGGTAYTGDVPVSRFGVAEPVPESFLRQLVWPFFQIGRSRAAGQQRVAA